MINRHPKNPLITPQDTPPSHPDLQVIGAFNPGACRLGDDVILLVRVAEACRQEPGWVKVPVIIPDQTGYHLEIKTWPRNGRHEIDDSDPRHFIIDGERYLSSLSHLRLARSRDGVHFTIDAQPFLFPAAGDEVFGVEDARVVQIGDDFYITYTATSEDGFGVGLAKTKDFTQVERCGMIFPPENKDVCFFPEKVGDHYIALHRPIVKDFGQPSIWYAESPDLIHWGRNSCLLRPIENGWDDRKIGAGPEPFKTSAGWLLLYHGVNQAEYYTLSLCLLDPEDPRRLLKRTTKPILIPEEEWEKNGFVPNVTFSNGWVRYPDGRIQIYYGASDETICLAETTEEELLAFL